MRPVLALLGMAVAVAAAGCGDRDAPEASAQRLLTERLERSTDTVRTASEQWLESRQDPDWPRDVQRLSDRVLAGRADGLAPGRVAALRRWLAEGPVAQAEAARRGCVAPGRAVATAGVRTPPGVSPEIRGFVQAYNRYLEVFGVVLRACGQIAEGELHLLEMTDDAYAAAEAYLRAGRARPYDVALRALFRSYRADLRSRGLGRAARELATAEDAMNAAAEAASVDLDLE